jgi:hypothetical protein
MNKRTQTEHVGELLSGLIDGELTQQDRQRVEVHCETCAECRSQLQELRELRDRVGQSNLSDVGQDAWRETMNDNTVKATRSIGWLLLIGGALIAGSIALFEILSDLSSISLTEKLIVGGIWGGLLFLFLSVLRQRLIERKTDKYKDVEI